jgi:voltage-gated potassium channel
MDNVEGRKKVAHRGISSDKLEKVRDAALDMWSAGRAVMPSTVFFALVILVATIGYVRLGWPPADALYMVVITVFSVGFGETHPVDTHAERVWTMLVIIGGWAGVVATLGNITKAVTEGELRRATESNRKTRVMEHLHDHVIICGYGRMGQTLARELKASSVTFVVIERDEERVAQLNNDGYLSLKGDATEEAVLRSAGIERAKVIATVLPQDALNVFITLTARELGNNIKIIARGEQPSTEKKLLQAGANEVILPATIGGLRIAHSIMAPEVSQMLDGKTNLDLGSLGIEIDELSLLSHSHLLGKSVSEVQKLGGGNIMVLGVRRSHAVLRDNLESIILKEGDALIAISRNSNLPAIIGRDVERTELM